MFWLPETLSMRVDLTVLSFHIQWYFSVRTDIFLLHQIHPNDVPRRTYSFNDPFECECTRLWCKMVALIHYSLLDSRSASMWAFWLFTVKILADAHGLFESGVALPLPLVFCFNCLRLGGWVFMFLLGPSGLPWSQKISWSIFDVLKFHEITSYYLNQWLEERRFLFHSLYATWRHVC